MIQYKVPRSPKKGTSGDLEVPSAEVLPGVDPTNRLDIPNIPEAITTNPSNEEVG